jgi:hypothetical protein
MLPLQQHPCMAVITWKCMRVYACLAYPAGRPLLTGCLEALLHLLACATPQPVPGASPALSVLQSRCCRPPPPAHAPSAAAGGSAGRHTRAGGVGGTGGGGLQEPRHERHACLEAAIAGLHLHVLLRSWTVVWVVCCTVQLCALVCLRHSCTDCTTACTHCGRGVYLTTTIKQRYSTSTPAGPHLLLGSCQVLCMGRLNTVQLLLQ